MTQLPTDEFEMHPHEAEPFAPRDAEEVLADALALATAVEEQAEAELAQDVEANTCPYCHALWHDLAEQVCRCCGFYLALGTCIELDEWEREVDGEPAAPPSEPTTIQATADAFAALPAWVWLLGLSQCLVLVVSVAVAFTWPAGNAMRVTWAFSQLGVGVLAAMAMHAIAYVVASAKDADCGMFDFVLKPIQIWGESIRTLPRSAWRVIVGAGGAMAAFWAVAIIGVPTDWMWDWNIEPAADKNLVGAIVAQAQRGGGEGDPNDLEDAIGEFTGRATAGVMDQEQAEDLASRQVRHSADCLVVGYKLDQHAGRIRSLLLARSFNGKLKLVGRVALSADEPAAWTYAKLLTQFTRETSFVPTMLTATWVEPKFTCRISYSKETKQGRYLGMKFERPLETLD